MWYMVKNVSGGGPIWARAYAKSPDGITWTRPKLGLVDIGGSTDSNLIAPGGLGAGISIDEGPGFAPADERFKYAYWDNGMRVCFSADGLHWADFPGNPVLPFYDNGPLVKTGTGDIINVFRDTIRHRYVAIVKMYAVPEDGYRGKTANMAQEGERRLVGQSESEDFIHWTMPRRIFVPEDRDEGITEFYGMPVIVRGDLCVGFLRVLRDDLPADAGGPVYGTGYNVLATSRDGENWTRDREVFFDRNPAPGSWDHAICWFGNAVELGDQPYLYYGALSAGHKVGDRQIGLARLRKDGFVSRDAGSTRGVLRTPAVTLGGSSMALNVSADGGEIRVRILDRTGQPIPGFTFDDCRPVRTDSTAAPAQWRGDLRSLRGRSVVLEFAVRRASLYGFELM